VAIRSDVALGIHVHGEIAGTGRREFDFRLFGEVFKLAYALSQRQVIRNMVARKVGQCHRWQFLSGDLVIPRDTI
jgi:hypothetical protein